MVCDLSIPSCPQNKQNILYLQNIKNHSSIKYKMLKPIFMKFSPLKTELIRVYLNIFM
jgi:hypothetical protein